jgi:hypothetical protein
MCIVHLTYRQSVTHRVKPIEIIHDLEIKAKQFANPLGLQNYGQALIQHELHGVVVGEND